MQTPDTQAAGSGSTKATRPGASRAEMPTPVLRGTTLGDYGEEELPPASRKQWKQAVAMSTALPRSKASGQAQPVPRGLADGVGDQRRGLGDVESQSPRAPGPGEFGGSSGMDSFLAPKSAAGPTCSATGGEGTVTLAEISVATPNAERPYPFGGPYCPGARLLRVAETTEAVLHSPAMNPNDAAHVLRFSFDADSVHYAVELQAPGLTARNNEVVAWIWDSDLVPFLEDLATNYRGWDGEHSWQNDDRDLKVSAVFRSGGHVRLTWTLQPWPRDVGGWSAWLEAGEQMTSLAADVRHFLTGQLQ